jgi:hypothetical protein
MMVGKTDNSISTIKGNVWEELVSSLDVNFTKVLSGYKGGYEHKVDEMSACSWLLGYRSDGNGGFLRTDKNLVFIHEGEWNKKYIGMLAELGWDVVLPLVCFAEKEGGLHDY